MSRNPSTLLMARLVDRLNSESHVDVDNSFVSDLRND